MYQYSTNVRTNSILTKKCPHMTRYDPEWPINGELKVENGRIVCVLVRQNLVIIGNAQTSEVRPLSFINLEINSSSTGFLNSGAVSFQKLPFVWVFSGSSLGKSPFLATPAKKEPDKTPTRTLESPICVFVRRARFWLYSFCSITWDAYFFPRK